jgi:amidase
MTINHYSSATEMLAALKNKDISSSELTEMHIDRIEAHDAALNAIPVRTFDRARASAKAADEKIAKGETAPLLGLPMTLKESTQTAGLPQTAGIQAFEGYTPAQDGKVAAGLFHAGVGLLGKTNIPVALGDWQADSPVYGRTNNPWDLERTPGGSTGGGGAALASGMTSLEIGSDIGGSIRVPAAFCGVYGHRPTETAVPKSGAFPLADLPNPAFLLGVQGPLARSATDLELLFDQIRGPEIFENIGWQQKLPQTRHKALKDFRVAVIPPFADSPVSSAMGAKLEALCSYLSKQGAKVETAMPAFNMEQYLSDYARMLIVMTTMGQSVEERKTVAAEILAGGAFLAKEFSDGLTMTAQEYLMLVVNRQSYLAAWQTFFQDWDVLIGPMTLDSAFTHQTEDQDTRTLMIDNKEVPYFNNILYPMLSILCGLPSTAFPAGLDPQGLPLGLQAIGPYLEDKTTLRFAQLLEQDWHCFQKPPGY